MKFLMIRSLIKEEMTEILSMIHKARQKRERERERERSRKRERNRERETKKERWTSKDGPRRRGTYMDA